MCFRCSVDLNKYRIILGHCGPPIIRFGEFLLINPGFDVGFMLDPFHV